MLSPLTLISGTLSSIIGSPTVAPPVNAATTANISTSNAAITPMPPQTGPTIKSSNTETTKESPAQPIVQPVNTEKMEALLQQLVVLLSGKLKLDFDGPSGFLKLQRMGATTAPPVSTR